MIRQNSFELYFQSKTEELRKKILQANSEPILLNKTINNKPLYLMCSVLDYDEAQKDKGNSNLLKLKEILNAKYMLLTTVFVGKKEKYNKERLSTIGFHRFNLTEENIVVNGALLQNVDLRKMIEKKGEHLANSYDYWKNKYMSIGVEPQYRKQGIGGFMIAASIIALDLHGGKLIETLHLLDPAINVWKNFGVGGELIKMGDTIMETNPSPIKSILSHPHMEQAISEFI